jgi:hypothetical protein
MGKSDPYPALPCKALRMETQDSAIIGILDCKRSYPLYPCIWDQFCKTEHNSRMSKSGPCIHGNEPRPRHILCRNDGTIHLAASQMLAVDERVRKTVRVYSLGLGCRYRGSNLPCCICARTA